MMTKTNSKSQKGNENTQRGKMNGGLYVTKHAGQENDPSWYSRIPNLLEKASNISWYNQLGREIDVCDGYMRVPGIMGLDTVTGPGTCLSNKDPMNVASINIFEFVRKALNKPNPDYEAQDIMMMLFATEDLFVQYCDIMRAFGLMNTWDADNLYVPKALLSAGYGWDNGTFKEAADSMANLMLRFDTLIYKASWLFLPTNFTIMDRHAWLFSNVFQDHHRQKAQMYIHNRFNYWKYNESKYDTGTCVEYKQYPAIKSIPAMLDAFDDCIEALRNSSSVRIMQSDMRKAFENATVWKMATTSKDYFTPITCSDEVLMQIENSRILTYGSTLTNMDVTQDVTQNCIIHKPTMGSFDANPEYKIFEGNGQTINTHLDTPTASDVAVATRGMYTWDYDPAKNEGYLEYCSDFIIGATMINNPDPDADLTDENILTGFIDATLPTMSVESFVALMANYYSFDWAPRIILLDSDVVGSARELMEYDNYTQIDDTVLRNLNIAISYSLWYTDVISSWSDLSK